MVTYIVYIKGIADGFKVLRIKASGYVMGSDGQVVYFDHGDKRVAMFNVAEIIGFVRADAVEN